MGHRIHVLSDVPIRQRNYPVSPVVEEQMQQQLDQLLEDGVVERSTTPWVNPIVMVKQNKNKWRMCLDFRKLNQVTKKDAYPLRYLLGVLDKWPRAKIFTTIDMTKAYHQIQLEESSREYTGFVVPGRGLFHFIGMPFGLAGAPPAFQRLADELISPEFSPYVHAYLDDIIVATETFEEHMYWLERVLQRLTDANLKINPEKSKFCREKVEYLGFIVSGEGVEVDESKVEPVKNFPAPTTVKRLRSFLGLTSWYRRFIPDFATVAEPLTRLTSKKIKWEWGVEQTEAFEKLKELIATAPVLVCPDFSIPFELHTDASNCGLGAVLTQKIDEQERVLAFASRILNKAERNYDVMERECLAVVWAVEHFRRYLEGYHFTVITDHSSLRWLHNLKNPSGRVGRWALRLQGYDYEIIHRAGKMNVVPDALSRMFEDEFHDDDENGNNVVSSSVIEEEIAEIDVKNNDAWYDRRLNDVRTSPQKWRGWKIVDENLYRYRPRKIIERTMNDLDAWKLVPAKAMREHIISENYDDVHAGHLGIKKTVDRVSADYYWPRMHVDIEEYVRICEICQTVKVQQVAPAGLMGRRVVDMPWAVVAADIMGPFPLSKIKSAYLLVFQDLFTKWIELFPIKKPDATTIIKLFEENIVCRWGTPEVIVTDNGTEFSNNAMKEMAQAFGIHHQTTPPYHAQANPVERVNRVLKPMIISYIEHDHREWDLNIPAFRFAYNTAVHSSLEVSPAFLNLGRQPRSPKYLRKILEGAADIPVPNTAKWRVRMEKLTQLYDLVSDNITKAFERQARYYNKHHRDVKYKVGDRVRRRVRVLSSAANYFTAKLARKYTTKIYTISHVVSDVMYELKDEDDNNAGKYHIKDLIAVREKRDNEIDNDDESEIELGEDEVEN